MLERLNHCPLCNSGLFTKFMTCRDFTVSGETFTLTRCDHCNFLFTNPRPSSDNIGSYYQSNNYISHSNRSTNPVNFIYKLARTYTVGWKVRLINGFATKGTLLDIGCGTGHFLTQCKKNGWEITGVEPDPSARALAHKQTEHPIANSIDEVDNKQFNVITLWHVLEHISDLNPFMEKLKSRLHHTGTLIIAVPNYKSFDANLYQQYWAGYDVPRHLYHFEQNTMQQLTENHGMRIERILPMKLDAYYVSLLSETYKNDGLHKYFKSMINGCKSNKYAKNNANNYSSLIYIIRLNNA